MNTVTLNTEKSYWLKGYRYIAGVDEAGRGPLAGPLVCASVIFPDNIKLISGINDSKKISKLDREYLFPIIIQSAISVTVSIVDEKTIDILNIYQATVFGMKDCLINHFMRPEVALIDGMDIQLPDQNIETEKIIKGDTKVMSIAAASIIAKVTRDNIMTLYDRKYPQYHFGQNAGYPTKLHKEALMKYGVLKIHRKSYKPVKDQL